MSPEWMLAPGNAIHHAIACFSPSRVHCPTFIFRDPRSGTYELNNRPLPPNTPQTSLPTATSTDANRSTHHLSSCLSHDERYANYRARWDVEFFYEGCVRVTSRWSGDRTLLQLPGGLCAEYFSDRYGRSRQPTCGCHLRWRFCFLGVTRNNYGRCSINCLVISIRNLSLTFYWLWQYSALRFTL